MPSLQQLARNSSFAIRLRDHRGLMGHPNKPEQPISFVPMVGHTHEPRALAASPRGYLCLRGAHPAFLRERGEGGGEGGGLSHQLALPALQSPSLPFLMNLHEVMWAPRGPPTQPAKPTAFVARPAPSQGIALHPPSPFSCRWAVGPPMASPQGGLYGDNTDWQAIRTLLLRNLEARDRVGAPCASIPSGFPGRPVVERESEESPLRQGVYELCSQARHVRFGEHVPPCYCPTPRWCPPHLPGFWNHHFYGILFSSFVCAYSSPERSKIEEATLRSHSDGIFPLPVNSLIVSGSCCPPSDHGSGPWGQWFPNERPNDQSLLVLCLIAQGRG